MSVFQEVDSDLGTILFDYSDSSGANNPGGVQTYFGVGGIFGLNAPGVNIDTSNRLADGAQDVTFSYDDIVQSSFKMRAVAASYDNLRLGIGTLQRLLASDGVIRWVPEGSANTYYIYRKPSPVSAIFAGRELETYRAYNRFEVEMDVAFNRERLLRGPVLLSSVNKLPNSTMLLTGFGSGVGMANWVWDNSANITTAGGGANVNWPTQSYRFQINTTSQRNFQEATANGTAAAGDVWTFSVYAKATGGTQCKAQAVIIYLTSGGSIIGGGTFTGTLTTLSSTEQRLSVTTTAAPATTDHLRVQVRFTNGDATSYTVDLRRGQVEKAATASQFRVGSESVLNNITDSNAVSKALLVYNPGDANAIARVTLSPSSGSKAVAFLLARRSEGLDTNLTETINAMALSGGAPISRSRVCVADGVSAGSVTIYGSGTALVVDSGSSEPTSVETDFSDYDPLVRRWRWVTTPTDPAALHGTWRVYAAVRGEIASTFRVCMHWQAANRDPVANVEDEIPYDTTDVTSSVYTPLYLGEVTFDADAGDASLVIEGWAARDSGSGSLWWDVVYLVPSDEQITLLQVPGFRAGDQANETWLGSELTNPPAGTIITHSVSGTKSILITSTDAAGTPPGGVVWAAGQHVISALMDVRNDGGGSDTIGHVRIRKAPGPGGTVPTWQASHSYSIGNFVMPFGVPNGRTYRCTTAGTSGGSEPTWGTTNGGTTVSGSATFTETTLASRSITNKSGRTLRRQRVVAIATADGSTAYEGVVVANDNISTTTPISVLKIHHSVLRTLDDGYSMEMLGDLELIQTANGATAIDDLVKQGPFITLGPGLNVLWVDLWTLPPHAYNDADPRAELAKHDPTRSTTVSVDIQPRFWG